MSVTTYSIRDTKCLANMKDTDSHKLMLHLHMFNQIDQFIPNRFPTGQGHSKGPPHRHSQSHVLTRHTLCHKSQSNLKRHMYP